MENEKYRIKLVKREIVDMPDTGVLLLAVYMCNNSYYGLYCSRKSIDRIYYNYIAVPADIEPKDFTPYPTAAVTNPELEKAFVKATKRFATYQPSKIQEFIKNSALWVNIKGIYPRMISNEVVPIPDSNCVVVALCKLDDQHYAAIYDVIARRGHVEYAHVRRTGSITFEFRPIYNDVEWSLISNFFNTNNVFELARIDNSLLNLNMWHWQTKNFAQLIPKKWIESVEKKRHKRRIS